VNPYLIRLREKYEALRTGIEGLQTRAAEAGRDLTEDELRSISEQAETAKGLATQIADLSDIETRNAQVANLAADLDTTIGTDAAKDVRDRQEQHQRSRTTTKDRDPGHYRAAHEGGTYSFFGDLYAAGVRRDPVAQQRLEEHNRALSTGTNGPGVVAPHWMTELFQPMNRQGRALAARVNRIPLGDDPRPITVPKQTAGTDNVVAEQVAENNPVGDADAWDSDVDTVTPKPTSGSQKVSRQLVDMSSPAIDQLIYADLMSVYDFKVETKVAAAMLAAAGASVVSLATEAAFTSAAATDAVIDQSTAVWTARLLPPDILAMSIPRFGRFRKLKDGQGRPLMPFGQYNVQNGAGVQTGPMTGEIEGLVAIPTAGMGTGAAYPEKWLAARSQDVLLFESDVLRFRYEEVAGPQSIVLGVWGYTATYVMYGGAGVKAAQVTAA
jgi:HK97 family phage major capsid protein